MTEPLRLPLTRPETLLCDDFDILSRRIFSPFDTARTGAVVGMRLSLTFSKAPVFSGLPALILKSADGGAQVEAFETLPEPVQDAWAANMMRLQATLPKPWDLEAVVDRMRDMGGEIDHFHFDVAAGAACISFEDAADEIYHGRYYDDEERVQTHVDDAVRMIAREAASNHARLEEADRLGAAADLFRRLHPVPGTDGEDEILLERPAF